MDALQIKIEKAKAELSPEAVNAIASVDWKATILGLRAKYNYNFEQLGDLELETELLLCGLVTPEEYPKDLEEMMEISKAEANELVNEMNKLVFTKIREELIKNTEKKNSPLEEYPLGGGGQIIHPGVSASPEEGNKQDTQILKSAGIEILPIQPVVTQPAVVSAPREEILKKIEKLESIASNPPATKSPTLSTPANPIVMPDIHPMLTQKISGSFQIPMVKTEYSLENISKTSMSKNSPLEEYPAGGGGMNLSTPSGKPATPQEGNKEFKTPVPKAPKVYPKSGDPYRLSPE